MIWVYIRKTEYDKYVLNGVIVREDRNVSYSSTNKTVFIVDRFIIL